MHVMRYRPHVVEELRVHGPAVVLFEKRIADQSCACFGNRIAEQELFVFELAKAQAFMPDAAVIRRLRSARKPAFIDAAAVSPIRVPIVWMQLDALAGMQER